MRPLLLINPNTNADTTAAMLRLARGAAPTGVRVEAATAPHGAALIHDTATLAGGATAVAEVAERTDAAAYAGLIVAAFGDPGMAEIRATCPVPVTGIAEAGITEAAAGGRRFAIVTTTPGLVPMVRDLVSGYGHAANFLGVHLTAGDAVDLMSDRPRLERALARACEVAAAGRAEAVVIGGGPLAEYAGALRARVGIPIIEPVSAAVRLASARARTRSPGAVPDPQPHR
ncbi:aspartate/glutamate racemase family protein [Nocardia sp. BMG51109]|uniref:aspartate/glutamate racemase family protein n=1 Tax=Nocardia sp. BMG51109 TaxID=1056816 RepID=UPI000466D7EC|nr:aspartate/glutamate racemase family protein [Nocardia sp. BMG51109]